VTGGDDAETAMQRMNALLRRVIAVGKKDVAKVEETAQDFATDLIPERTDEPACEE